MLCDTVRVSSDYRPGTACVFATALKASLESIPSPARSCGTLMYLERILSGRSVHQFSSVI